jgi:hypothetical protein
MVSLGPFPALFIQPQDFISRLGFAGGIKIRTALALPSPFLSLFNFQPADYSRIRFK